MQNAYIIYKYMTKETLSADIQALLPDRPTGINDDMSNARAESVEKAAEKVMYHKTAKELAKLKRKATLEAKRIAAGIPEGRTEYSHKLLSAREEIEAAKAAREAAIEAEIREDTKALVPDLIAKEVIASPTATAPEKLAVLTSTTKADVTRLLGSLNLNLNMRLSKTDMSNILATLLTCNEAQLKAVANNPKVPVVIKIIVKRLQDDLKLGSMTLVEDLWDRIFGKGGMLQDAPSGAGTEQGLIPGTPISREAYILLRDTIIK